MLQRVPGYNDLDLIARQSAMQTLVLTLIARKVGVSEDGAVSSWISDAENDARATLVRLEEQAKERSAKGR